MESTAEIRKENKRKIYSIMMDGRCYTKQQMAGLTGLSVATCNTLLNDLFAEQILLLDEEKELRGVGRASARYRINPDYENYLLINLFVRDQMHHAEYKLTDVTGSTLYEERICRNCLDISAIVSWAKEICKSSRKVAQILVSVAGVVDRGRICFCDLAEMEGLDLERMLSEACGRRVTVANDMHLRAYGYQALWMEKDEVVTLAGFYSYLLPGTVTMHKGQIISGANGIAGLAGFMPFSVDVEKLPEMMEKGKCLGVMEKIIGAIIAFLNPEKIVFAGDLVTEEVLEKLYGYCRKSIPESYMPVFLIETDFESCLFQGMLAIAQKNKEF